MQVNLNLISGKLNTSKTNFTADYKGKDVALVLFELPEDTFEKSLAYQFLDCNEDDEIAAGPFGHPYSGRPIIHSDSSIDNLSWIDKLFLPREMKKPKTFIGRLFSLGGNDFDDDVSRYHAQLAKDAVTSAKGLLGKDAPISIPIGDLNKDGVVDTIISGINKAIDITGDGEADLIGTLIDTTGDGKANFILTKMGELIEVTGSASVVGDSKLSLEDLKAIPQIVLSLLGKN